MQHPLLGLTSLLLVVLASLVALLFLRRIRDWSWRRDLQLAVLAAPLISLGLGLAALHHFTGRICFIGAPPWDHTLGTAVPLGMGLVVVGALAFGAARLLFLKRAVARATMPAEAELQALAEHVAQRLGTRRAPVLVHTSSRPLAFTCGLVRPKLVVSRWMAVHLDRKELEAVLAHELAHIARRDQLVIWLATILRDAFFYLPTSWAAHRQLAHDKELACDEIAVHATKQPLALASALGKAWRQALGSSAVGIAPSLADADALIEVRLQLLLAASPARRPQHRTRLTALGVGVTALAGLFVLEGLSVAALLAPMGCSPVSLSRLF